MRYFFRIFLAIILIGSVFYNRAITEVSTTIVNEIRNVFALPLLAVRNFFKVNELVKDLSTLALENQSLEAELLRIKMSAPKLDGKFIRAKVYASYPFNNKSALTIARGSKDGLKEGLAVLAAPGIYLGIVSYVEKNWSEIRTVFDSTHETSARIGERGIAALLRGGSALTASMVDKTKVLNVGEIVYLAQKGLPYGLKIGEIRAIHEGGGGVFKEADVITPYFLNDIEEVLIYAP